MAVDAMDLSHDVERQLQFASQSQPRAVSPPTASQNLANAFRGCQIQSQSQPVAAFNLSQAYPTSQIKPFTLCNSQSGVEIASQDFLSTPDFITPADQQYGGPDETQPQMRSPAQLSPTRAKRQRPDPDSFMDLQTGSERSANPTSTSGSQQEFAAPLPRKQVRRRMQSPPCLRNIFLDGGVLEDDANLNSAKLPKHPPPDSRYRADFKEISILGQGNFSKVFRVRGRRDGCEYAIKRSLRELGSDAAYMQWSKEVQALAVCSHPNIVRYYSNWMEQHKQGEHLFIQMECCDISLGSKLTLGDSFREADLLKILRQMAAALQHIHANGMAHLDVKPDNIYSDASSDMVKLGDFGLATPLNHHNLAIDFSEGDCRYLPQELLNDQLDHLDKADMFALGISIYELASGNALPAGGGHYHDIRQGKFLLPTFSTSFQKMLKALMSADPQERPSASKLMALPIFNQQKQAANKENSSASSYGLLNLQSIQRL